MKHILVFAGTTEGRIFVEQVVQRNNCTVTACTATEYGKVLLPNVKNLTIIAKRQNEPEMATLMRENLFDCVYDATHPFALEVSENIRRAAKKTNTPYVRILRPKEEQRNADSHIIYVDSIEEAVKLLAHTTGNILSTIGSKELHKMCQIPDFQNRVYARILPLPQMVTNALELGFTGKHLICMQGPFSEALHTAMLREFDIAYTLSKDSGKNGGLDAKIQSAIATNTKLLLLRRPDTDFGITVEEALQKFEK